MSITANYNNKYLGYIVTMISATQFSYFENIYNTQLNK